MFIKDSKIFGERLSGALFILECDAAMLLVRSARYGTWERATRMRLKNGDSIVDYTTKMIEQSEWKMPEEIREYSLQKCAPNVCHLMIRHEMLAGPHEMGRREQISFHLLRGFHMEIGLGHSVVWICLLFEHIDREGKEFNVCSSIQNRAPASKQVVEDHQSMMKCINSMIFNCSDCKRHRDIACTSFTGLLQKNVN